MAVLETLDRLSEVRRMILSGNGEMREVEALRYATGRARSRDGHNADERDERENGVKAADEIKAQHRSSTTSGLFRGYSRELLRIRQLLAKAPEELAEREVEEHESGNATRAQLCGSGELGKEVIIELQRQGVEVIAVDRYEMEVVLD